MRPQPVLNRAAVVAVVGLVVAILRQAGVIVSPEVADLAVEAVAILGPLAVAWWSQRHVTPVDDPRDAAGRPLVTLPPV